MPAFCSGRRSWRAPSEELGPRALLDAELRRRGLAEVSLTVLARVAEGKAPELARRLHGFAPCAGAGFLRGRAHPEWSRAFSRLLRVAGWPGDRDARQLRSTRRSNAGTTCFPTSRRSKSFPARWTTPRPCPGSSTWRPRPGLPRRTRVRRFRSWACWRPAGSVFDHLWVTGLEDRVWPAPPRPNPFLASAASKVARRAALLRGSRTGLCPPRHSPAARVGTGGPRELAVTRR